MLRINFLFFWSVDCCVNQTVYNYWYNKFYPFIFPNLKKTASGLTCAGREEGRHKLDQGTGLLPVCWIQMTCPLISRPMTVEDATCWCFSLQQWKRMLQQSDGFMFPNYSNYQTTKIIWRGPTLTGIEMNNQQVRILQDVIHGSRQNDFPIVFSPPPPPPLQLSFFGVSWCSVQQITVLISSLARTNIVVSLWLPNAQTH